MQRYNNTGVQDHRHYQYSTQSRSPTAGKFSYWNVSSPKIHEINSTEVYKHIKRPILTADKIKKLEDQLNIEKEAYEKYRERVQAKKLILPFRMNPLTHDIKEMEKNIARRNKSLIYDHSKSIQPQKSKGVGGPITDRSTEKKRNLLVEIEKFRRSKGVFGRQVKNQLKDLILKKEKISHNLSSCIPPYRSISPAKKNQKRQEAEDQIRNVTSAKKKLFKEEIQMEDILKINEDSFYTKRMKIQNILSLAFKKKPKINMGHPFIDRYNFCHESNRQVVQKLKVPIFRDISQFARSLIKNIKPKKNKLDYLDAKQTNVDADSIDFEFLLSVGSGRITSLDLIAVNGEEKTKRGNTANHEEVSSIIQEKQIDYPSNTRNVCFNKFNRNDEIQQNELFHAMEMSQEERDYKREFERQLLELTATFREEKIKYFLKIEDFKLDQAIQKKKSRQTQAMVEQLGEQTNDKERIIRRSKQKKDRTEEIKIKALITAAKLRKEFEAKLKKEKGPSQSPSARRHGGSSKK